VLKPIAATSAPLADERRYQVSRLVCGQMRTRSKSEGGVPPVGFRKRFKGEWDSIFELGIKVGMRR